MYRVVLVERARRFYEKAEGSLQRKLDRCFEALSNEPRLHPNVKSLKGQLNGHYRFRVGDYRVIYRIDAQDRLVVVAVIAHRREAY